MSQPAKSKRSAPNVLRQDECEKCGSEIDSFARPDRCANEQCNGPMVEVKYVPLNALLFHLRYHDWQEDTAADAIEAWVNGNG